MLNDEGNLGNNRLSGEWLSIPLLHNSGYGTETRRPFHNGMVHVFKKEKDCRKHQNMPFTLYICIFLIEWDRTDVLLAMTRTVVRFSVEGGFDQDQELEAVVGYRVLVSSRFWTRFTLDLISKRHFAYFAESFKQILLKIVSLWKSNSFKVSRKINKTTFVVWKGPKRAWKIGTVLCFNLKRIKCCTLSQEPPAHEVHGVKTST